MKEYCIMEIEEEKEREKEREFHNTEICERNFNIYCNPSIFQTDKN